MGLYQGGEERTFVDTYLHGTVGEEKIRSYLLDKGFVVVDRSQDKEYQEKDIDFEYSEDNVNFTSVEVKSDRRMAETHNIVVEMAMHRQTGTYEGWYHKCEADVLCFYDEVNSIAYFINWPELKQLIKDFTWSFSRFDNGADNCWGTLCKISLDDLRKYRLLIKEFKI